MKYPQIALHNDVTPIGCCDDAWRESPHAAVTCKLLAILVLPVFVHVVDGIEKRL